MFKPLSKVLVVVAMLTGLVQTRAAHGRDAAGGDGDFSHRK